MSWGGPILEEVIVGEPEQKSSSRYPSKSMFEGGLKAEKEKASASDPLHISNAIPRPGQDTRHIGGSYEKGAGKGGERGFWGK